MFAYVEINISTDTQGPVFAKVRICSALSLLTSILGKELSRVMCVMTDTFASSPVLSTLDKPSKTSISILSDKLLPCSPTFLTMKLLFSSFLLLAAAANGFMTPTQAVKPGLSNIVDAQPTQKVAINLDIGGDDAVSRLAISGMTFDLHNALADYEHVLMPGFNGPHPKLSSGIRKLDLLKYGEFVSLAGAKTVKAIKGCWEMVWKEDSPAGALICGFEISEEYKRNDAVLSPGRIYLSFPVWTKETLAYAQAEKDRILSKAAEALKEKDAMMEKFYSDPNPLMKALHYRNAYAAAEMYYNQPVKRMEQVPDDDEVIQLQDNLFCTTKGTIWSKALPRGESVLLGAANLKPLPQ